MLLRIRKTIVLSTMLTLLAAQPAWAIRFGAMGNSPIDAQPGWPEGAAAVFNARQRIAYWELNGQWTSDCRGDAEGFNRVLEKFAQVDAERKEIVVHDGVSTSDWVGAVAPDADAQVDWKFVVWQPEIWKMWQGVRPGAKVGPPPSPRIDVYVGGNINWDDVVVPEGIDVDDQRLEAHGFTLADGTVFEGTAHDLSTGQPLADATVQLVRVDRNGQGGYDYTTVKTVDCGDEGHWVITSAPQGLLQVVLSSDGYAPRILGYAEVTEQPGWSWYDSGLSPAVRVSGTVTDDEGDTLAGAKVRLDNSYGMPDATMLTGEDGRFEFDDVPAGTLSVRASKAGFNFIGPTDPIEAPAEGLELTMGHGGRVAVVVDFGQRAKPESYLVHIEPEGGEKVGSWSGTAAVDASGFKAFQPVPPGRYVIWGRPNPGGDNEQTEKVTVEVKGDETVEVELKAK